MGGMSERKEKRSKVAYGTKSLLPKKVSSENVLVRISIVIDSCLLKAIKKSAATKGVPYRMHLQSCLRDRFMKGRQ